MKLKSFGCSFIYGSDLSDCPHSTGKAHPSASRLTWPALLSQKLGMDYECHAWPGTGNLRILDSILHQASKDVDALFVISWTWIDRFDYVINDKKPWQPWAWRAVMPGDSNPFARQYYRDYHSQIKDQLTNVIWLNQAVQLLLAKRIPFLMTYMDGLIIEKSSYDHVWMQHTQSTLQSHMHLFDDMTFLKWSKSRGFAVSHNQHPLEQAHESAADLMWPKISSVLDNQ